MPTEAFEVIVSVNSEISDEDVAIAEAAKYLAYADQTDTFGYSGNVVSVTVYGDDDLSVGLQFVTTIINEQDRGAFLDEMESLAWVETVEELSYVDA